MTKEQFNRAIMRLRRINRASAEKQARAYAESLLPQAARHRSVTDLAALAIMSIALYCTAASCISEERGAAAIGHILDQKYASLTAGNSPNDVFAPHVVPPEGLETCRRLLAHIPAPYVAAGLNMVREVVRCLE